MAGLIKMMKRRGAFGAYRRAGWHAMMTKNPNSARWGKIEYVVERYSGTTGKKPGSYCATAKGTGKRRASRGYALRNEGRACASTAGAAIAKAVKAYLSSRSRKIRRK
jgi:hypothetical protein